MREGVAPWYPASPRVGRYGHAKGRWYIAAHRLGRTVRAVHGDSWDGLVDGQPYTELVQSATERSPDPVALTQAQYDALSTKDPATTYIITED